MNPPPHPDEPHAPGPSPLGAPGMNPTLPVIDLAGFDPARPPDPRTPAELDDALRRTGFCYIADTGIDPALVESVFDASRRFHALPAKAKQAIAINEFHRGYIAPASSIIRSSSVARITRPNSSESFMAMHEVDPEDEAFGGPLQGLNQWPAGLPGFRETVTAYREAMSAFARRFNRLLARALALPATFFDPHFQRPTIWLRLMHYPPEPPGTPDDQYGAAPHTDYGFITFLAQDALGGLEVRARDGGWIPAPPLPDTFVVNVADMLARFSNDRWPSTPHRVRNTAGRGRYSVPFFWDTGLDSEIACLPTCAGPDRPPRYEPVRYGDYVIKRLDRNYGYRQRTA